MTLVCDKGIMAEVRQNEFAPGSIQAEGTIVQSMHNSYKFNEMVTKRGSKKQKKKSIKRKRLQRLGSTSRRNKTSTKRAVEESCRCSFRLRFFCYARDCLWYLCWDEYKYCTHRFHFRLEHSNLRSAAIPSAALQSIKECNDVSVPSSNIRNLIHAKFGVNVSLSQIRELKECEFEAKMEEVSQRPYGTAAERLISYFNSLDDVSFMYTLHCANSGFVTTHRGTFND